MDINADFETRAAVHAGKLDWIQSPMPGVERRMLDRMGDEVARATTIVKYAPGSAFSPHVHTGGEEYLVLDGVFQDESGDFPAGSYVRNPPQSSHTPRSDNGATILVKLWQFDLADREQVHININTNPLTPATGRPGVSVRPLFSSAYETVRIELWEPKTDIRLESHKGLEIFVLEGGFNEGGETFVKDSWLRLPIGHSFQGTTHGTKTRVWVKQDHLSTMPLAPTP